MPPITWRNIDAPDMAGTAGILYQGNNAVQQGVLGLQQLAAGVRNNQIANVDNQTARNTDQLLQTIRATPTLTQQQALTQQLTPQALQQQYGAMVDGSQVQRALQDQVQTIRTNEADTFRYEQDQLDRADNPRLRTLDQTLSSAATSNDILNTPIPEGINNAAAARTRINDAYTAQRNKEKLLAEDNLAARTMQMQKVITDAFATGKSKEDVQATAIGAGQQLELPAQTVIGMVEAAGQGYDVLATPTATKTKELNQFFSNYDNSLKQEAAAIDQLTKEQLRRNPATAEYSQMQEAEKNLTQGNALEGIPGWNQNDSWFDTDSSASGEPLRTRVQTNLQAFEKEVGQPIPGWMIAKAGKMTGVKEGPLTDNQVNSVEFDKNLRNVFTQYQKEQDGITRDQNNVSVRQRLLEDARQQQSNARQQSEALLEQLKRASVQGNTKEQAAIEAQLRTLSQRFTQPYRYTPPAAKKPAAKK